MGINSLPTSYILTADIGGSHITAGICDLENYTIYPQSIIRAEVNSRSPANNILNVWGNTLVYKRP